MTIGILGWLGQRQVIRIDKLEEQRAHKEDMSKVRQELRDEMKEHREETRTNFQRVFDRLDTIVDRVSR